MLTTDFPRVRLDPFAEVKVEGKLADIFACLERILDDYTNK